MLLCLPNLYTYIYMHAYIPERALSCCDSSGHLRTEGQLADTERPWSRLLLHFVFSFSYNSLSRLSGPTVRTIETACPTQPPW